MLNYLVKNYLVRLEELLNILLSECPKLLLIDAQLCIQNFIESIGPIIRELSDIGHSCVGCYGEMDARSRLES